MKIRVALSNPQLKKGKMKVIKIKKYCIGGVLCFLAMSITAHADNGVDVVDLKTQMSQEMAAMETRLAKDGAERETRLAKEAAASESRLVTLIEEMRAEMKVANAVLRSEMKADIAELRSEMKTDIASLKESLPSAWTFYLTVWGAAFSIIITIMITMMIAVILTVRGIPALPRQIQSRIGRAVD